MLREGLCGASSTDLSPVWNMSWWRQDAGSNRGRGDSDRGGKKKKGYRGSHLSPETWNQQFPDSLIRSAMGGISSIYPLITHPRRGGGCQGLRWREEGKEGLCFFCFWSTLFVSPSRSARPGPDSGRGSAELHLFHCREPRRHIRCHLAEAADQCCFS